MTEQNSLRIWDYLDIHAEQTPNKIAWFYQGEEYSFAQAQQWVDRVACGLLANGYQRGDKLGIIAFNQPEWLVTYLAAMKIGVTAVGLNVRYREDELVYMLEQSGARGVVCIAQYENINYVDYFQQLKQNALPALQDVFVIDDTITKAADSFNQLSKSRIDKTRLENAQADLTPDDPSLIIYTSGTTGRPKGAVLTHRSQLASVLAQNKALKVSSDDVISLMLPFNHVGGLTCGALVALVAGMKGFLMAQFSPALLAQQIPQCPLTMLGGVPTMFHLLLHNPEFINLKMPNLRTLIVGAAAVDLDLIKRMRLHFEDVAQRDLIICNIYGMTETSGMVIMSEEGDTDELLVSSIGIAMGDTQIKVIDDNGNSLPIGEIGELCIKGTGVIKEYYKMPEASAKEISSDGWLNSGDLVMLDEHQHVHIKGRKKEMYVQGGFNVYPIEVENIINQHPDVMICAGVGIADEVLGEVGKYFIMPVPNRDVTQQAILDYCKDKMANYKLPKYIEFRDTLPMTPTNKVKKNELI